MPLKIQSDAFPANGPIPSKYSGDGEDISPALRWTSVPAGAKELALIVDDPDAPRPEPWVHWLLYAIPPGTTSLPDSVPPQPTLASPAGAMQGTNDFKKIGYGGPAPPRGHGVHHYQFRLHALDAPLNLKPGADVKALRAAMKGHVLEEAEVIGTYERR